MSSTVESEPAQNVEASSIEDSDANEPCEKGCAEMAIPQEPMDATGDSKSIAECEDVSRTDVKSEIFKKPVFLIGPRKGKPMGKIQTYKPPDDSQSTNTQQNSTPETPADIVISEPEAEATEEPEKITPSENKSNSKFSPAQKLKENSFPLPYKEPKWSGIATRSYKFEVLKNGSIVETIDLSTKPFYVFGRLVNCDVHMAHPTVSRFHAVLQYRSDSTEEPAGFYIYDLGSTHGTFLNKYRIKPNMYVRVHVGHLLKLGGSSRMFILHGPEEDMEEESELTVTELKEKRKEQERVRELEEIQRLEEERLQQEKAEKDGIDWGMGDDAEEETDLSENPFAATQNEELYLEDPKKTLRGWFEREGYDLEYNVEEKGFGQFLCRVELPVETARGGTMIAEALVKGKKKEAVVQCALEACRILDRQGLLRQATHESKKRKAKNWEENDFYDSDEDTFLDRTGDVEKKRQRRMRAAGKLTTLADTYESLMKKHEDIISEIDAVQKKLEDITRKINAAGKEASDEEDPLDAFMSNLSSDIPDRKIIGQLKSELASLKQEEANIRRLVNIARPASLPELLPTPSPPSASTSSRRKVTGTIGSRLKLPVQRSKVAEEVKDVDKEDDEEEEDEEDEEDEKMENNTTSNITLQTNEYAGASQISKQTEKEFEENKEKLKDMYDVPEIPEHPISVLADTSINPKENDGVSCAKEPKIIGPARPPVQFVLDGQASEKRRKRNKNKNKKDMKKESANYSDDPNYSMWVPPEDQSGDGRTKLNEKFGY